MDRIFAVGEFFRITDGTLVSPFLNPMDVQSELHHGPAVGFSISAGLIEPWANSKIHIHPYVSQVTYVLEGTLTARLKERDAEEPSSVSVAMDEAVLLPPGAYFQLVNTTANPCRVL